MKKNSLNNFFYYFFPPHWSVAVCVWQLNYYSVFLSALWKHHWVEIYHIGYVYFHYISLINYPHFQTVDLPIAVRFPIFHLHSLLHCCLSLLLSSVFYFKTRKISFRDTEIVSQSNTFVKNSASFHSDCIEAFPQSFLPIIFSSLALL